MVVVVLFLKQFQNLENARKSANFFSKSVRIVMFFSISISN